MFGEADNGNDGGAGIPVVALDGPGGSGKGAISAAIVSELGWHYLDSGALYRVVGYLAHEAGVGVDDVARLVAIARALEVTFKGAEVWLDGVEISDRIRHEEAGNRASLIAPIAEVRKALLVWQRRQARAPGLVADGRDMGSVVFPQALVKIFLTASPQCRAERRYKQLRAKGFDVTMDALLQAIVGRDERDSKRKASPLKVAADAMVLDTTAMDIPEVVAQVMAVINRQLAGRGAG